MTAQPPSDNTLSCSFCERRATEVHRLIPGPNGVYICDNCVGICHRILFNDAMAEPVAEDRVRPGAMFSPREITAHLDEYVVGQTRAKRVLSVAVYNHYKRIRARAAATTGSVELEKSNILLVGPTGSGKTLMAQTLARILDVPFCIADATSLTEAGYVGEDVENILLRLIQAADGDISRAERGIIYIDEIDKISRKSQDNPSITRDVSGEGVQQALLKIIEGTQANVPPQGGRKHPHQDFLQIDTTNILFICGGTFEGIEREIGRRLGTKGAIGFSAAEHRNAYDRTALLRSMGPEDAVAYGLIPELVGRLPVIATVDPLDREALTRILTEPRNALVKQYTELLGLDDVALQFEEDALGAAADLALARGTGARGLRGIIETCLLDVMFETPGRDAIRKVVIDAAVISGANRPRIYDGQGNTLYWTEDGSLRDSAA